MTLRDSRNIPLLLRNVHACYFFSGAAGLVYQVLWLRKLLLVFGNTVHAVSTILTVFFGGLALGSWFFGRLADRNPRNGLRWYALLEALIGLYAFATPWLFNTIRYLYIPLYRASGFSTAVLVGASLACSALILLIPTTLLGGTFPVLNRFLIRSREERGPAIARLYGINTAGAMAGTLFVYYVGLPSLGLARTLISAGLVNVLIALVSNVLDRNLRLEGFDPAGGSAAPVATPSSSQTHDASGAGRWIFWAFALSGFSAMVYEVAWTRALSLVLGSSIYAFCILLATFLGGMAIGSFRARRNLKRHLATIRQFLILELLLGAYGFLSVPLLTHLPECFVALWPLAGRTFLGLSLIQSIVSGLAMLVPTFLMGLLFPLVSELATSHTITLGQRLGGVYAVNTMGGIAGSFLSGFVLIPTFGLARTIIVAGLVNLLAGLLLYVFPRSPTERVRRLVLAGLLLSATGVLAQRLIVPLWRPDLLAEGAYLRPHLYQRVSVEQQLKRTQEKLLYYRESLNTTVSVHQKGNLLFLKVGGKTDASNMIDMKTQVLLAHVPLLLHPDPKRMLVIGLGSGVTLGHASRYPLAILDCAELDPAVIEGARFFHAYNYDVHRNPRVTIRAVDGRNFLLATTQQYDVIASEPSNPWMAGIAYLFTQEFYELAKRRLAPNGLMCQWIHLYRIAPEDVKLILKTFHETFPHVSVWSSIPGDMLLVGSMTPHAVDYPQLVRRMESPAIKESLKVIGVTRPEVLLQLFWFGSAEVEQLTADITWSHQDDQPSLEFTAPKALYVSDVDYFKLNYEGLTQFKRPPQTIAPAYPSGEDPDFYRDMASMWAMRGEADKQQEALERLTTIDPSSSAAWLHLGEYYLASQQYLKAERTLAKAVALDPRDSSACLFLARVNWKQRRLTEAQAWYERAASLNAPDRILAEEMARCLNDAGAFAMAAECYRSSLSQGRGDDSSVVLGYARVLRALHSWDTAEYLLRFALNAFPTEAAFPLLLGDVLMEQRRPREAKPFYFNALALAPQNADGYYALGRIAEEEGDREKALQYLLLGLQYNPYHHNALELLRKIQR